MKLLLQNIVGMGAPRPSIEIRRCRPERGWFWLRDSYALFRKNPLVFVFIYCILFLSTVIEGWLFGDMSVGWVPISGLVITFVIGPMFTAGLAYAYQVADRDEDPEIEHLFVGFRDHFYDLLVLGLMIMLVVIAAAFVTLITLVFAGSIEVLFGRVTSIALEHWPKQRLLVAALAFFMLYASPAFVAMWFAPSLVLLRGRKPWEALRESVLACWRNILPFFVLSAIWVLFILLLAVVGYSVLGIGGMLLFGVGIAIFGGALYTSYKEVFPEALTPES